MKPYYEEAGITIYHGDCREILPSISAVDCVITDPPYSDVTHKGARTKPIRNKGEAGKLIDFGAISVSDLRHILEACSAICRRWMIGFVDWRHIHSLETEPISGMKFVRFGVWVKPNGAPQFTGDRPATGWEALAIMHSDRETMRWNGGGSRATWTYPQPGGDLHPTQKPIELVTRLLQLFTDDSEAVLDPFMGSGTTLLAAKELGRRAVGIELEEHYCEISANRLRQSVFDFEAVSA